MTKHFFGDTAVLTGRSLRHITRSPDTIITTAIMPIAFMLLFVYVLGGAINSGSHSYVSYLLPGILLITIASGISYVGFRLFLDMQSGIFQRFHSMPIARSSVLWAHVLTSLVANLIALVIVVLVALLMGFRSGAGVLAWLAVAGILILFTLGLTWIAVIAGLSAKSADGAGAFCAKSGCAGRMALNPNRTTASWRVIRRPPFVFCAHRPRSWCTAAPVR